MLHVSLSDRKRQIFAGSFVGAKGHTNLPFLPRFEFNKLHFCRACLCQAAGNKTQNQSIKSNKAGGV